VHDLRTLHEPATYRSVLQQLTVKLQESGVESPALDARRLLEAATGVSSLDIISNPDCVLEASALETLDKFAQRRVAREPVSRILGMRLFYGREFQVTPDVLDPRPDTETLIDACLEIADAESWRDKPMRIVDIGTGSGCILVTLLAELPLATGLGTDISTTALETASRNAVRLGVSQRASFVPGSGTSHASGPFDLLVSNPPYIPSADILKLDPEVRCFDPHQALDGGADGLTFYRLIADGMTQVVPRGWAVVEVGAGQAAEVASILMAAARSIPRNVRIWRDLGGHGRCVAVRTQ
jgi:release factor glutamine methyltransferase